MLRNPGLPPRWGLRAALTAAAIASLGAATKAGEWADERHFGPVVCRGDLALAPYEGLFRQLVDLQRELGRTLAVPPPCEPIEVYLFRDQASYADYLASRLPAVPYRRALYVKAAGPGRVYVFRSKELPVDLRHESTHALLHAALPMVPLWLDEGLAEYFEVPAEKRAFDNPHLSVVFKTEVQLGKVPGLAGLEARSELSEMTAVDYRNAWAWVHFMFHGPRAAHEELVRYLADIGADRPAGQLSQRLAGRLPNLDQQFRQHFRTWQR